MKNILIGIVLFGLLIWAVLSFSVVRTFLSTPADMIDAVSTGVEIKQIQVLITDFQQKRKRWPTEDEFQQLIEATFKNTRNDSLQSDSLVDMWGEPYNYFRKGSGFALVSMGPDRKPGTRDDIILLQRN